MYSTQQMSQFVNQYNLRKYVSSAKTSPLTQPKPIETVDDSITKRERIPKSQHQIQDLLQINNANKLNRILSSYQLDSKQITQQDIIQLILRIYTLGIYEQANFLQKLFEQYIEKQHRDVLQYIILHSFEQLIGCTGNATRLLEIFQEMISLNPDFATFQEEYQIEQIDISFNRIQLRCMFLLNQYDVLRSLRGAVALFEQLEGYIFQQLKSNALPTQNDIKTLVIAYILLSEQLQICSKFGLTKQALEIINKSNDIYDLRKKFILNASKLSHKYLGHTIFEQINSLNRKLSPDNIHSSHLDPLTQQFLIDSLDMNYLKLHAEQFEIDKNSMRLIAQPYLLTLMEKILPDCKKKDKVLSGYCDDVIRPGSGKQFQIKTVKNELNSPTQSRLKFQNNNSQSQITKQLSNRPPLNQQLSSGSLHSSGKLNQFDSQEFEMIQNKLVAQQRELEELKQLYNNQSKKQDSIKLTEQLQSKIDLLESNLTQLKQENSNFKKEKDQKSTEVIDLKTQLQDLTAKQSQLEKLLQAQSQQQQMIINQQNLLQQQQLQVSKTNTSATINIQIPPKEKSQNILNQLPEEFNDEASPHMYRQNQSYISQLLEMLDTGLRFSKYYYKYQSKDENNQWNNEVQIIHTFKIETTVLDTNDGKSIILKAFNEKNQLICSENINLELLKGLIGYVDLQEMLPTNQPSISTTHQFFKYLILPYTAVVPDELTGDMKLQFWPKPYGLFNGLTLRIDFLDANCLIYLHHLETDQFRIAICEPTSKDTLRLDLEMDYSTMDQFFKDAKSVRDQYSLLNKTTLLKMTEKTPKFGDDDVAEALQERHFEKNKAKQIQLNLNESFMIENLQLKSHAEFLKYIKSIVTSFEQFLKQLKLNFQQSLSMQKYFRCRSWNTGTRNQLQTVIDLPEEQEVQVYLQNCFETFGPNKTKLKVKGQTQVPYSVLQREFSIMYEKLAPEEKTAINQQLLYSFNLNIFEKACEQSPEQFDSNPIIQNSYECGSYKRLILYDNQKIAPVTISVIGANRRMCGVKFSVFSPELSQEIGVFLPTSQLEWDLRSLDKQKIKSSVENVPFAEYFLTQILKCPTVTQILFKKILNIDIKHNQINSDEIKNRKQFVERIDNLITWQEVLAILN